MTDRDHSTTLRLEGRLAASQVAELENRYRTLFEGPSAPAVVNLEAVENGDSSALALLLDWQARARDRGMDIRFEQPPEGLRVIARLTGVAPLLGWSASDGKAQPEQAPA